MEFHAIILCGPGRNLSPFSKVRSSGQTKALLPVENDTMVEKVLDWCEKAFFSKVTLIVDEDDEEAIQEFLKGYKLYIEKINAQKSNEEVYSNDINIVSLPKMEKSGSVLYYLYKQGIAPFKNFVILPCDFITNLPPQVLIENYRNKNDTDVGLIVYYRNNLEIEDKKKKIFPTTYTIYNEENNNLLDLYTSEDIEFHKLLKIRTQMCWRYPNSIISKKLLNSSIFFGSTKIFDIFESESRFNESYFNKHSINKIIRDLARRSWKHSQALETIGFSIIPDIATFFRINNNYTLMEANRYKMQEQLKKLIARGVTQPPKDKLLANVGLDSLVGKDSVLGERTNVIKSVLGSHCKIGKRVKLTGTLIMNNVTIDDDVQLENCIIGNNVKIHSKTKLTNCFVESTHEVPKGTITKGETMYSLSLEGIVEDFESDYSDSEESEESDEEFEYGDNSDGLFDY